MRFWTVGDRTFPERLKRLRLARGMTQKELAQAAGCAWNLVYRWERGFNGPAPRTVRRVAGVLGVGTAELVGVPRTAREAVGATGRQDRALTVSVDRPHAGNGILVCRLICRHRALAHWPHTAQ